VQVAAQVRKEAADATQQAVATLMAKYYVGCFVLVESSSPINLDSAGI